MAGPSRSNRESNRYFNEQTETKAEDTSFGLTGKAIRAKKQYKKNKMGYTDYMSEGGSLSYKDWLKEE